MKPINIYALTRISDISRLERLERQMSGRKRYLKIKPWEIEGLRQFSDCLASVMELTTEMDFYYSFTMPKLGKEFDLLRVNENCVVNIELKSGSVTDEAVRRQLLQNRYYLAMLGKSMYFYTYISGADRLVRLSHGGRLLEAEWEELANLLARQENCFTDAIEDLFKEDRYLISPLADPGRFLRQEYFLTAQQREIKKQILREIQQRKGGLLFQGFTGLPGTGKTLLLYDLAMRLSWSDRVCVFHFGSKEEGLEQLDQRLKRVDFYYCRDLREINPSMFISKDKISKSYTAILVDEGHRISAVMLESILACAGEWDVPVIFSYDREDAIAAEECKAYGAVLIEGIPGYIKYRLTNRIRMNSELSSFVNHVMSPHGRNHRREYRAVSIVYAENLMDAKRILRKFQREGYYYIKADVPESDFSEGNIGEKEEMTIEIEAATCKEFDCVVMLMDESFIYDEKGYLRCAGGEGEIEDFRVKNLFHGLSRAKRKIAVVVLSNEAVFDELLYILQGAGID